MQCKCTPAEKTFVMLNPTFLISPHVCDYQLSQQKHSTVYKNYSIRANVFTYLC